MEEKREIVISFRDLWQVFLQRLWLMLIAGVLVSGAMLIYKFAILPDRYQYSATQKIYILQNDGTTSGKGQASMDYNDFTLALQLVKDCQNLLLDKETLRKAAEDLKAEYPEDLSSVSAGSLASAVSVENPTDSRILAVTAKSNTAVNAQRIADKVCEIGLERINGVMGNKATTIYEDGSAEDNGGGPVNGISYMRIVLFALIAVVAVYGVCLVIHLLQDRIASPEEAEARLGLAVLGDIPDAADSKRRSGYYKRHYGRKYGYYGYAKASVGKDNAKGEGK